MEAQLAGTDREWEKWGQQDPYFAVLTLERFRSANLNAEVLEEFFASGVWHVDQLLAECRRRLDANFQPTRVLDFGCGVGRLLVAFANQASSVVGVDVSQAMLDEARANCERRGLSNVHLVRSDDTLSHVDGVYDLVHSTLVFQHIDVPRGRELFRQLVERLAPGGIAAIHVAYGKLYHAATYGQLPPPPPPPPPPESPAGIRASVIATLRSLVRPSPPPVPATLPVPPATQDPEMQMNPYPLSDLAFLIHTSGITEFHATFTDHGGELGVVLLFRRPLPAP